MSIYFYDTETVGLHGFPVLLQFAIDDGPIILYEIWKHKIKDTLALIENMMGESVVGFNISFDHFHLTKTYNTFRLYPDLNEFPINCIDEIAILEKKARDGPCLKPAHVLDLMLHARKGSYQSTMERGDIRVKKVPIALANHLAAELERRIPLKDIYFMKRKDQTADKWSIYETDDENFRDIVLKFHPTNSLKALTTDALGVSSKELLLYSDIELSKNHYPKEYGYAPFALSIGKPGAWNDAWPEKIHYHIAHWSENNLARKYAEDDVKYTRALYHHFGSPPFDDNDSVLACLVASVRWRGFKIDELGIEKLKDEAFDRSIAAPTAPEAVKEYLYPHLSEAERVVIGETTKKVILEEIAEYIDDDGNYTEAATAAHNVLDARMAKYEINFYNKLLVGERLSPDYNVIGTLSSRMSGSGGLNVQGIKKSKAVRACFPLAFNGYRLCGGDFVSFEVAISDAVFDDPELRQQLQTIIDCPFCSGSGCKECGKTGKHKQTIHGLFGTFVFPDFDYVGILKTKGTSNDLYTKSKSAVFAMIYGGTDYTLKERLGVPIEVAGRAYQAFSRRFPKIGIERRRIQEAFEALSQPEGIGTKIYWKQPADFVESLTGFRRYFTLENMICRLLFELAEKPPKEWTEKRELVVRREREQTVSGAVRSALFASAFALQESNKRAATNHRVQSTGAIITKALQVKLWELQPIGIHDFNIMIFNIHDELMATIKPKYIKEASRLVREFVIENKKLIPLLEIDWKENMNNWGEK